MCGISNLFNGSVDLKSVPHHRIMISLVSLKNKYVYSTAYAFMLTRLLNYHCKLEMFDR